jgi:hypothetical protein
MSEKIDIYEFAVGAMNSLEFAVKVALEADIKAFKDQDYTDEAAVKGAIRSIQNRVKDICFNETKVALNGLFQ